MALAGYDLKLDFGDPAGEARACRTACALFDFSFLECARVSGPNAQSVVEKFGGRSLKSLQDNGIRYALRVDRSGHAVADLTLWRNNVQSFDVISGRREDIVELLALAGPGIAVDDLTANRAVFALQGPRTLDVLRGLGDGERIARLDYFTFTEAELAGIACTVGRLGYTGEPGVEIIVERRRAAALWQKLSVLARPGGFIAADTLRIEAGFVLFSNEFRLLVMPAEAGLGKFQQSPGSSAPAIKLVSFRAEANGLSFPWQPPATLRRPTMRDEIAVTSACDSIMAGGILGLGYVSAETSPDMPLHDPTGVFCNIKPTALPCYDTAKQRPRTPWR